MNKGTKIAIALISFYILIGIVAIMLFCKALTFPLVWSIIKLFAPFIKLALFPMIIVASASTWFIICIKLSKECP